MDDTGRILVLIGIAFLLSRLLIGDFLVAMLVVGVVRYICIKAYNLIFVKDESFND